MAMKVEKKPAKTFAIVTTDNTKEGEFEKKKKKAKKSVETNKSNIFKVLKQLHPNNGISGTAMSVMNNLITDFLEKLTEKAWRLARHKKNPSVTSREIQTTIKLVLPGVLVKHAIREGINALTKSSSA